MGAVLGPKSLGIALVLFGILGSGFYGLGWALRRWRWTWAVALAGGILILVLIIPPTTPFTAVERTWVENSGKVRAWDWWIGWEMFKDHPLVGVGLGNYKLNFIPYKAKFFATSRGEAYTLFIPSHVPRAAQAHNDYVQALAELGSLGILATLALLVIIPLTFWCRLRRNADEGDRLDLILFGCGVVTFLVHAAVDFPAHLPASSLVLVLVLGLFASSAYGNAAEVSVRLKGWPHKALVALLTAFCLAVSVIAARDYKADRLLNRGIRLLQVGQLRLAESTFAESARLDFCPRQTYYYLATAKLQQGRFEEARVDLERCLARFVVEQVYFNLANLAVNQGDVETARKNVELLLATRPHPDVQIQAEYLRAMIAIREGDYDYAINALEALVEAHPGFERSYIALGSIFRARGMPVNARKYYEKALEIIEPRLSQARNRLASVTKLPAEEYANLRNTIQVLTQAKEAVEAGLAQLPPVETWEVQSLPVYRLDEIRDVSVSDCVRLIADIILESKGFLPDGQLIEIARQTVNDIVSSRKVNAVTVAFWRPETIVDKKAPAALVDWAPKGEWDKAATVATGDYSAHSYRLVANETAKQ